MAALAAIPGAGPAPVSATVTPVRVGLIGHGYWGANILRNLRSLSGARLEIVCDSASEALQRARQVCPELRLTQESADVLFSPEIEAVAIITPVWTHFELAKAALQNGKHVFLEKPLTSNSHQAEELIELAEQHNLTLMVDHTFLFTGAVRKIRQLIYSGTLGALYYYDSMRVNLGMFQHDVNVVWDLAPHDLSIMDYLVRARPEAVSATGQRHVGELEDVAFITVYFPEKMIAHINVNWLSPVKVRSTLIGGERRMLVWNDLEADEKIKVYDKGVNVCKREEVYELLLSYRSGDAWIPHIRGAEALQTELDYFLDCVANKKKPINDGKAGLRVVKLLEAASRSLAKGGELVYL
ncbi:MAG TPA: Gfo/Idh/MocA family oxidoreductase [Terriglobales bacterium]|nr:Gfo/Idh/MocA family oxidoreductase [Terriglobales bacterium]